MSRTPLPFRRICIFGAGALGGAIAARLVTQKPFSDITVSAIARGTHLAAIRRNGLRLWTGASPEPLTADVLATDDASRLGPQDLVITALKGHQLPAAAKDIASLLHTDTRVLMILNGIPWWYFHADTASGHEGERLPELDPRGDLWRLVDPVRVIGCVAYYGAEVLEPGGIHLTDQGRFVFGEPSGLISRDLENTSTLFEYAGWQVHLSGRIRDEIWQKLLGNASFNPISALTRATLTGMIDNPEVAAVVKRIMAEVRAVGESLGARFNLSIEERVDQAHALGPIRSSMLQDLERGRALEIDPLLQAVVTLGRVTGVSTPTLDVILALVRQLDRSFRSDPY